MSNATPRVPVIAGNWKMNNTVKETETLLKELVPLVAGAEAQVVVCVPFTDIKRAVLLCRRTNVAVGAQNVAWAEKGAFTGEISADMLKEAGAKFVIIGHSERRQYFGETDETVNKRLIQTLSKGLTAIVCVGETLEQREAGITEKVIKAQLDGGFADIAARQTNRVIVAYEPVWAIGTGKTASAADAQATVAYIRTVLKKRFGAVSGEKIRIQYGGSMNAKNVDELMAQPDIDGGLIGGASLKAEDFARIVKYKK